MDIFYVVFPQKVEVVINGCGLALIVVDGELSQQRGGLCPQDISFCACGNTMERSEKTVISRWVLSYAVEVDPPGLPGIELQEQ